MWQRKGGSVPCRLTIDVSHTHTGPLPVSLLPRRPRKVGLALEKDLYRLMIAPAYCRICSQESPVGFDLDWSCNANTERSGMVVHDDTSPMIFAPAGTLQGSQDATNGEFVAGWAWNSAHPGIPLHVEVYDGDTLLTTVEANCFRPDLRDAGIGNGYHAFVCGLTGYIRDRRQHIITVRVAGTRVCLPDFRTGGVPVAITRQERPTTPPIPHFSLSPTAQWFYFTFLQTLLRPFPRPVWRLPAILLATINTSRIAT